MRSIEQIIAEEIGCQERQVHAAVALLDDKIKKAYENVQRVFIEAEARHSVLPSGVK